MTLRTLEDLGDVADRRAFVRVDYNVPLDGGKVADDSRITASLPTLRELLHAGASLVLASHLGRPKGTVDEGARMGPIAERLAELIGGAVGYDPTDVVVDDSVERRCAELRPGEIVMLENLRFDPGEEANDGGFAERLVRLGDVYVDDAFGAVHRAHASVAALPALFVEQGRPAVAGRLLQKEVEALSKLLGETARPYVAVLGGAKVSDKLSTVEALVDRVDALLIGGAMAFTFIAAQGGEIGKSLVEPERFDRVLSARKRAEERDVVIQLPEDAVAAREPTLDAPRTTVPASGIPKELMGLDIGPRTVEEFAMTIAETKTILWNGPMGVFELEPFSAGTRGVATAIAGSSAYSVAGGGDSLLAIKRFGLEDGFDHLSTGGGASLEFLEGRELPGVEVLEVEG
ncbi:MAG: phosphoglycerate kinase [Actinomycetota bacterium]